MGERIWMFDERNSIFSPEPICIINKDSSSCKWFLFNRFINRSNPYVPIFGRSWSFMWIDPLVKYWKSSNASSPYDTLRSRNCRSLSRSAERSYRSDDGRKASTRSQNSDQSWIGTLGLNVNLRKGRPPTRHIKDIKDPLRRNVWGLLNWRCDFVWDDFDFRRFYRKISEIWGP